MPLKPANYKNRIQEIKTNPEKAFFYSRDVMKTRWPEAEPYIMKHPAYACLYATDVLKKKWPEAEPYIKNSAVWQSEYKIRFGK